MRWFQPKEILQAKAIRKHRSILGQFTKMNLGLVGYKFLALTQKVKYFLCIKSKDVMR